MLGFVSWIPAAVSSVLGCSAVSSVGRHQASARVELLEVSGVRGEQGFQSFLLLPYCLSLLDPRFGFLEGLLRIELKLLRQCGILDADSESLIAPL